MYARVGYAQAPWAGTLLPAPNVGQLPPPIPSEGARFSYSSSGGAYPWAYPSWAGGVPPIAYPGGGVLVYPLPEQGVMKVVAWWPSAAALNLVRITADGTRSPVRGAYPITMLASATRRNWASNPSIEVGTNGYVPDVGNPTLTQLANAAAPAGSYVLRATNASSGSSGVTVPTSLTSPASGQPVTVGWSMRTSARPTSVTLTIGWANSAGQALATSTATLTADQINTSVNTFARQVLAVIPPAGAVTPTVKLTAAGMPAGGQMDLDAITIEVGATDGSAFDGHTVGAVWLGTADLSASVLAPLQTVYDAECPFDTLVSYQVSYPGITGGRVQSDPITLSANGTCWLSHPLLAGQALAVDLQRVSVLERGIDQGIFWPLDGRRPVVVSAAMRQSPTGEIVFNTYSFDERDTLREMLADGMPVLLRGPANYGYGPGTWMAFASVTEDREERLAWQDFTLVSGSFVEVDAPAPDVTA